MERNNSYDFCQWVELTVLRDTADHLCCGPDNSIDPPQLVVKSARYRLLEVDRPQY